MSAHVEHASSSRTIGAGFSTRSSWSPSRRCSLVAARRRRRLATGSPSTSLRLLSTRPQAVRATANRRTPVDDEPMRPSYLYPPLLAECLVPLTFAPVDVAAFVAFARLGRGGVRRARTRRCARHSLLCGGRHLGAGWNALEMANVTVALTLAVALVWRYPRRPLAAPRSTRVRARREALPLAARRLGCGDATVRSRVAGVSRSASALVLASWAVIGFTGLTSYPDRASRDPTSRRATRSSGSAAALGLDPASAGSRRASSGDALLVGVVRLGRREDERTRVPLRDRRSARAFAGVWLHYLVLLIVPLAIARPRFSAVWLLPIVLWVCPRAGKETVCSRSFPAIVVLTFGVRRSSRARVYGRDADAASVSTRPPACSRSTRATAARSAEPRDARVARALARVDRVLRRSRARRRRARRATIRGETIVAIDFRQFYGAAQAILDGDEPVPRDADEPTTPWGGPYPYPPLPALLAIPLTLLPLEAAGLLVMALLVCAALAVPFVLGVRDWRCYGLLLLWPPVISAIQTGTSRSGSRLRAAIAWRLPRPALVRRRASIGLTLAAKFFLWPLVVWLAATRGSLDRAARVRRRRRPCSSLSWAVIGFAGLRRLSRHSCAGSTDSSARTRTPLYIVGLDLGLPSPVARGALARPRAAPRRRRRACSAVAATSGRHSSSRSRRRSR